MTALSDKKAALKDILSGLDSAVVAYSAGVDSTFLLKAAKKYSGRVIAATLKTPFVPDSDINDAVSFCRKEDIEHVVIELDPMCDENIRSNPSDRCYHCKKMLFNRLLELAECEGADAVLEGSNADDMDDYRPGMKAVKELGIKSPLLEAGLEKHEIRKLSKEMNLPTWDRPSAACLASRIPYGDELTLKALYMAEEAEKYLASQGFYGARVRIHSDVARIEVSPNDLERALDRRKDIHERLKKIGFNYVALDLLGYRTGSLNEAL